MKTYFPFKTLVLLAVGVVAAAGLKCQAEEPAVATAVSESALPESIVPGSPAAEVVKLAQAGVDPSVIQTYITNCPTAFNLDADKIIALNDAGVTGDMVNAMFAHDKNYLASIYAAAPPPPANPAPAEATNNPETVTAPEVSTSAPPTVVNVNYFNDNLAPYGSWVEIEGYGRCWRPTVVVYDSTWQPYCDRGHWVYTDCGWYWNSDYAWGATFHYGRWFNSPRYGWCWWPDTVWAPSWVTWRSSTDYCGWAPLPPFSSYQAGVGFTYRGNNVAVSFGFGLASSCYTFVSYANFCQPQPRHYCVPRHQVEQFYNRTAICNNYNWHNHAIVNNGVSVTVIGQAAHRSIQPVNVGSIGNASRHGWRGQYSEHSERPAGATYSPPGGQREAGNSGFQHGSSPQKIYDHGNRGNVYQPSPASNPRQPVNRRDYQNNPGHSATAEKPSYQHSQNSQYRERTSAGNPAARPTQATPAPAGGNNQLGPGVGSRASGHNNWPSASTRQPSAGSVSHSQLTPVRPPSSPTAPAVATGRPQRSDPRQNISQTAPTRTITPNNGAQVNIQRPHSSAVTHDQVRSVSPSHSLNTPSMAAQVPRRLEPSSSHSQSAPKIVTPTTQPTLGPAQNQNTTRNGGNRQDMMTRNP